MIFDVDHRPIYTEVDPTVKTKMAFLKLENTPRYWVNRVRFSLWGTDVELVRGLAPESLMETLLVVEAKVGSESRDRLLYRCVLLQTDLLDAHASHEPRYPLAVDREPLAGEPSCHASGAP